MPDLRNKRVLVTGGAGFVGSHIVDALVQAGAGPIAAIDNMTRGRADNLEPHVSSGRVELITGDICDRALMRGLVERADIVFHQAALRITQCAAEPDEAVSTMVDATFDLFRACAGAGTRKVIFASSASIYGMAESFPTDESHHPYGNRTLYGAAKTFGEGMLRAFNDMSGLDYVALRYFNVYGPRMDLHGRYTEVLVRWMERISAGEPPIVFGDGLQTMDMVDVRDVARANILAARSETRDAVFNVGSGSETSLLALAESLAAAMGKRHLAPIHAPERAVNPVPRRRAAVERAAEALGFRASIQLEDGLRDLVEWWRAERAEARCGAAS